jgi:hypothetical protein
MEIPRPTEADQAYFRSIVPTGPGIEVKPMFGNLAAFLNGNMFLGLLGDAIGVKLDPADAAALLTIDGAAPFGPPGRPMGGWVSLPTSWRGSAETDGWVSKALEHAARLPAKAPARRKGPGKP